MPVSFVTYIDESGDTGLDLVKKPDDPKGATEWLILSALVVKIEYDSKMVSWVKDVQSEFTSKRADLHFNNLLDFKKPLVCGALAKKDCKAFVVMSNKKNIEKYCNSRLDPSNKSWIYWFLSLAAFRAGCRVLLRANSCRSSRQRQAQNNFFSARRPDLPGLCAVLLIPSRAARALVSVRFRDANFIPCSR